MEKRTPYGKMIDEIMKVSGIPKNIIMEKYDTEFSASRLGMIRHQKEMERFREWVSRPLHKKIWNEFPTEQNSIIGLV